MGTHDGQRTSKKLTQRLKKVGFEAVTTVEIFAYTPCWRQSVVQALCSNWEIGRDLSKAERLELRPRQTGLSLSKATFWAIASADAADEDYLFELGGDCVLWEPIHELAEKFHVNQPAYPSEFIHAAEQYITWPEDVKP